MTVLAVVLAIPVILVPAAFIWYLNIGGIVAALKARKPIKAVAGER